MVFEFTERYTPEKFYFREKQITEIEGVFKKYEKFEYGGNLLLIGASGTGKTSITEKVACSNGSHLFLTTRNVNTPNKLLKSIFNLSRKIDTSELVNMLIVSLQKEKKVLIIDEIDKCSNVSELANILNTVYRKTGVPIIIISNKWDILNSMPDDAQKTLIFSRVEFPSYSIQQLKEILDIRLELIKDKYYIDEFTDEVREHLCGKTQKMFNGSVRILLDLALSCITEGNFTYTFIETICQKKDKEEWLSSVHNLGQTEKEFISLCLSHLEEKDSVLISTISASMPPLSSARISQIVKSLTDNGLITTRRAGSGSVGNQPKVVSFASQEIKKSVSYLFKPWDANPEQCANKEIIQTYEI